MEPEHSLNHLTDQQIASFLDPATTPVDLETIALHLDVCPRCEARLEEMEPNLGRIREGFHHLHLSLLPAGEPPLADLQRRMMEWESVRPARRSLQPFRVTIGAAIAAAILIALSLIPWGAGAELRAEMLLERAVEVSSRASQGPPLLYVQTRSVSFLRPARGESDSNEAPQIRQRFAEANYRWQEPLTAQAYSEWRQGLRQKSSTVTESSGEQTIRTTTRDGALHDASLTLDASLAPVRGRFLFADQEWVEITIAPEPEPVRGTPARPAVVTLPMPRPADSSEGAVSPQIPPLEERELDVYLALDAANVGAGTPIEMQVDAAGAITVTGYALSSGAEQNLRASLEGTQGVTVRIIPGRPESPNPSDAVDAILRLSQDTSFEAGFLRDLEDRFDNAQLPGVREVDLLQLRRRHMAKMLDSLRALRLAIEADHSGFTPALANPETEPQAEDLAARALAVNRLVTALYADQVTGDAAWSALESAFAELEVAGSAYAEALEVRK